MSFFAQLESSALLLFCFSSLLRLAFAAKPTPTSLRRLAKERDFDASSRSVVVVEAKRQATGRRLAAAGSSRCSCLDIALAMCFNSRALGYSKKGFAWGSVSNASRAGASLPLPKPSASKSTESIA